MTGLAEWLSLLQVCVEKNVEHTSLDFLSVSIWSAFCDGRQKHSLVFASIGQGRGGQKFLVSSNFSDKKCLKIELYHSCRLLLMILLQHNVASDGCVCLELLYILKPSLHSSGPQLYWNLVLCHQEMELSLRAYHLLLEMKYLKHSYSNITTFAPSKRFSISMDFCRFY
jgi:hypothetical protein